MGLAAALADEFLFLKAARVGLLRSASARASHAERGDWRDPAARFSRIHTQDPARSTPARYPRLPLYREPRDVYPPELRPPFVCIGWTKV